MTKRVSQTLKGPCVIQLDVMSCAPSLLGVIRSQPIMLLVLPVQVRPQELTVYLRSYSRRRPGATRPAKAR